MSEPLVIIGNGMAAARLADELAKHALGRYAVAVIGDEPRLAYNRVLLSSVLAREIAANEIELKPADWWRARGVTLRYGCAAQAVDVARREVTLADGRILPFSKLVFATGSRPLDLGLPGSHLPGVMTFRDTRDVERLAALGEARARVVVIGGGLLGLEAAYGLAKAGAQVTIVHLMDRLMERQLDARGAALVEDSLRAMGMTIRLNASTAQIDGDRSVNGVTLKTGETIAADAVVIAAGIRPNAELAASAGVAVRRGIVVDDGMQTNVPGIYAIGECAEHRGVCYGLVAPAYEQARVLATNFAGGRAHYVGSLVATNLKVSGVNVFSAGEFLGGADTNDIVLSDPAQGFYRRLVLRGDTLVGVVLVGNTSDGLWYQELIQTGRSVSTVRPALAFGRNYAAPLCAQAA